MEWINLFYSDFNWLDVSCYEYVSYVFCLVLVKFFMVFILLFYGFKLLKRYRVEGISRKDEILINWFFEEWIKDLEFFSYGEKKIIRK